MSQATKTKKIHILGGGTTFHVRPHLSLCAPAYGKTARTLKELFLAKGVKEEDIVLHLTKMAGGSTLETNDDVSVLIRYLVKEPEPKIIIMNVALCDYKGYVVDKNTQFVDGNNLETLTESGKSQPRLKTKDGNQTLLLEPYDKIISEIRKERKDIFLVGFKTTSGANKEEQFKSGMNLLKKNSCNLVLANDLHTRTNMVLTPEMASYGNSKERDGVLNDLASMVLARSKNTFTRTKVVNKNSFEWQKAPLPFRKVVEYCLERGAYQPFNGVTVGHFGYLLNENTIMSSRRKQNYNIKGGLNLSSVSFCDNGEIRAFGGKPSAGVRSQYELLKKYKQFDCVVHFHCPQKNNGDEIPVKPQKFLECGSHECGVNTSSGIQLFENGKIGAVMLDKHGPNILFNSNGNLQQVIDFIENNFELNKRTK